MEPGQALRPQSLILQPRPDGLGAFRRGLDGVFNVAPIGADSAFDAGLQAWSTGRATLSQSHCDPAVLNRDMDVIAGGGLDLVAVRLVTAGRVRVSTGPGAPAILVETGGLYLLDMLQPVELHLEAPGGDITLWAPRARLSSSLMDERAVHGLVLAADRTTASVARAGVASLAAAAGRTTIRELDALIEGVLGLLLRILPLEVEMQGRGRLDQAPASMLTIRRFIDQNLASSELNPEMIAATFGMSRASLYRLFEPVEGVIAYVRKQRLQRAFVDLANPGLADRKVETIAARWGFESAGAFTRAFKAVYGVSPVKARISARDGLRASASTAVDGRLIALLRG